MKKLTTILITVICLGVFIITCPDEQQHKQTVTRHMSNVIGIETGENIDSDYDDPFALVGKTLTNGIISLFINFNFDFDNYFLFSVGKFNIFGQSKTVSFGILGHVFIMRQNSNKTSRQLDNNLDTEDIEKQL